MARRKYPLTELEKYRMQHGYELQAYAAKVELSKAVVGRIEKGEPVRYATLAKYLGGLAIDMNKRQEFPKGMKIIDEGDKVAVQLTPQR